jgi:hypothetical protein
MAKRGVVMLDEVLIMKVSRTLLLCAAIALPGLASANSEISPQAVGIVQAVLDFCAKVDPKDAASFQAQGRKLTGGLSEHDLASLRGTPEYQDAFAGISDALGKSAPKDAARTCAAGVGPVAEIRAIHKDSEKRERPPVKSQRPK